MPIKNFWSLHPGEVLTAAKVKEQVQGCSVYFPLNDVGIDLLVAKDSRHVSLQVKASRYYEGKVWHNGWHQVAPASLIPTAGSKKQTPDIFIFLTYLPTVGPHKVVSFEQRYLVIPTKDLVALCGTKLKPASGGKYNFYFSFDGGKASDTRETPTVDYTRFLENWKAISSLL
jgi:hypothetical protein